MRLGKCLFFIYILGLFICGKSWSMNEKERSELKSYTNFRPSKFAEAKKFKHPKREYSVIVTDHGYYPDKLVAFEGERVQFFITSTSKDMGCFIMNSHDVFLSAQSGKVTEAEVVFKKAGRYPFYCPTKRLRGHITVLKKQETIKRELASKQMRKRPDHLWMPKDDI